MSIQNSAIIRDLLGRALDLSATERGQVFDELFESLGGHDELNALLTELERRGDLAWEPGMAEIERRLAAVEEPGRAEKWSTAEEVFDAASRDITVYFYGAEIGEAKAASSVTLELHVGDGHKDLATKPMPLDGETDATASRWAISGADLPADIKGEEQLDGHLEATMDGQPFSCALEPHSHDHDEHAHAEDAHAEGAHAEGHDDHADHDKTEAKAE